LLGELCECSVEVLSCGLDTDATDAADAMELLFDSLHEEKVTLGEERAEGRPWRKMTVG